MCLCATFADSSLSVKFLASWKMTALTLIRITVMMTERAQSAKYTHTH